MVVGSAPPRVRMRLVVQLAAASIGYVSVKLRRREVGVAEHLLDASQVGASLEEMRRERMAQEVRVDAGRLQPGLRGSPAQDQECPRAGERSSLGVEKELRAVSAVEEGTPAGEIAAQRLRRMAADRHDPFLVPLA